MGESGKAVFLSYASQDAEAACRICETLRAAGVEVWFDQSELRGGDAWDQKIRGQIKECALFMPIISANTQARAEGYFRLEWRLADRRTELMGKSKAFLVPISIDATRDADADVPDSFLAVQWMRLAGGEANAAFCERVKTLLAPPADPARTRFVQRDEGAASPVAAAAPSAKRGNPPWLTATIVVVPLIVGLVIVWRVVPHPTGEPSVPAPKSAVAKPALPQTEAQKLIAQIWVLYEKQNDAVREDWKLAEELGAQAVKLEPSNADAWAAYAQAILGAQIFGYDSSEARYSDALNRAQRAISLAPGAIEPQFALANCYRAKSATRDEAERILRELTQRAPTDKRILRIFASTLRMQKKTAESLAVLDRTIALPGGDPIAWYGKFSVYREDGQFAEAEAIIDRILAQRGGQYAQLWKIYFMVYVHDDLAQGRAALEKIPGSFLVKEDAALIAGQVWLWSGEPDKCLTVLAGLPEDTVRLFSAVGGPKGFLLGQAHQVAGRSAAAQTSWRAALQRVEQRAAADPGAPDWIYWRARLQACLGERAEAERGLETYRQLAGNSVETYRQLAGSSAQAKFLLAAAWAQLGRADEAIESLEFVVQDRTASATAQAFWRGAIRHDPEFAPLRDRPRFQALLTKLDAVNAVTTAPLPAASADDKSVAVLAFADQSPVHDSEYFSDGISEELINALGKVAGLKVPARTSSFYFKGKSVPVTEIAKQLGVAYVIEGSVQRVGDKVKIGARLTKATDGFQVWTETFTRDAKDVFAVEEEIAGLIAQNLQLKLGGAAGLAKPVNPEAHRLLLEGRHFLGLRDVGFAEAETAFTRALAIDANFAPAHAGLAAVHVLRGIYRQVEGASDLAEDRRQGRLSAERALQLDGSLADACAVLGYEALLDGRLAESERHFQRGLALNPNDAFCHHWHGHLLARQGRIDLALEENERATQIDPLSFISLYVYAGQLQHVGQHAKSYEFIQRSLALRREFLPSRGVEAMNLLALGRTDEAVAVARSIRDDRRPTQRWWADWHVIWVLRAAGQPGEAAAYAQTLLAAWPASNAKRAGILAAMGRYDEALSPREILPADPFNAVVYFFAPAWAPVRDTAPFQKRLGELGLAEAYQVARETLARLPRDPAAKK